MEFHDDNKLNAVTDSAYGGGKYRLSYDEPANESGAFDNGGRRLRKPVRVLHWLVFALIFAVIGLFILSYYNNEMKKIFGRSDDDDYGMASQDYSNVNVIDD